MTELDNIKNWLFLKYLYWQGRPSRIKKYLNKNTLAEKRKTSVSNKGKVKVGAVQLEMKVYQKVMDFVDKMNEITAQAAAEGVDLLVFPEYNLLQLIGLLPGISDKVKNETESIDDLLNGVGEGVKITEILCYIGPVIQEISSTIFSQLAEKYNLSIMAGSGMLPAEENKIYNIAYLFGADGRFIGKQKKVHLMPVEEEWGLKTGEELNVYSTSLASVALPVCMDATYFETFRILSNKGAEIIMIPVANPEPEYNYWTAMRGIWGRVQESKVYGIKSTMIGSFFNYKFTGQAGIYAPLELTLDQSGILSEAESWNREEIVTAELDLKALKECRKKTDLDDNLEFWERYFPQVYYYI